MASDNEITPEVEARIREIVRDEEQKALIRENKIAEEVRLTNAILAVLAMNQERQHREMYELKFGKERKSYSWRRFATDVADAMHTFENDVEELDK